MRHKNLRTSGVLALGLLLAAALSARGQEWARDMFNKTSHDFGTVARGAKVEYRFVVENIYVEDAHIVSARPSCGCTTPVITKNYLKTWEKAEIIAKVDTRGYMGQKDVTITVRFDRPFPAEVQLQVHCFIRSDVVVQPGVVQFGTVAQGAGGQQRVAITYAGNPNWQIKQVESSHASIAAQAVQVSRIGNQVAYDLSVTLAKTAPAGNYREQVFLLTNDLNPRAARVPVPVEVSVQPGITVHPEILPMGTVEPGQTVTRPLVVRGAAPFRIVRVQSSDPRIQCGAPEGNAAFYRIPVAFRAGAAPGKATAEVRIETDTGGTPLTATVDVEVVAPAGTPGPVTPLGSAEKPGPAGKVKPEPSGSPREL